MLSTTVVHRCRHCGSERIRKNGCTVRGAQRAKCLDCQRTLVLVPRGPRYDQAFKNQVLAAYQDRISLLGIKRTFGVCYQTVMKWLGKKAEQLPAFVDTLLPGQKGDVLEFDELWSFVGAKAQELWLWVALCRRTRQIVGWTFGDRSLQSAADLRASLTPGYRNRATRSDY
ncbi:MAG: IS1 family transposase [Rhodospirillales bacterium]|nr:IS1 family transposase [Acetobacter sp.]